MTEALRLPPNALVFMFIDARLAAYFTKIPRELRGQNYLMLEELTSSPRVLADIIEGTTWGGKP